jgi:hypothetical protein
MYTVVEFPGKGAEFGVPAGGGTASDQQQGYELALVAMAELEEGSHAPASRSVAEARIERLTERHMVAASPLEVAHFVSRQAGVELEYDVDRAQRIVVKFRFDFGGVFPVAGFESL